MLGGATAGGSPAFGLNEDAPFPRVLVVGEVVLAPIVFGEGAVTSLPLPLDCWCWDCDPLDHRMLSSFMIIAPYLVVSLL